MSKKFSNPATICCCLARISIIPSNVNQLHSFLHFLALSGHVVCIFNSFLNLIPPLQIPITFFQISSTLLFIIISNITIASTIIENVNKKFLYIYIWKDVYVSRISIRNYEKIIKIFYDMWRSNVLQQLCTIVNATINSRCFLYTI